MDEIPRRNRIDKLIPAEKAIYDAVQAVEELPAHPKLTDAVVLLQAARESVADYVDRPDDVAVKHSPGTEKPELKTPGVDSSQL